MFLYRWHALISQNEINVPKGGVTNNTFATVLQIVFGFAGAIALLVITIAGLRYITSQGNPQETAKAKNTIVFAIVGLIICIIAFSIVSFVTSRI